jgi:hypothetical protein
MAPSWTSPDCQQAVYDLQIDSVNDGSLTSHPGRFLRPLFVLREQKESMTSRDSAQRLICRARLKFRAANTQKRLAQACKTAEGNQLGPAPAACSLAPPVLPSITIEEPV